MVLGPVGDFLVGGDDPSVDMEAIRAALAGPVGVQGGHQENLIRQLEKTPLAFQFQEGPSEAEALARLMQDRQARQAQSLAAGAAGRGGVAPGAALQQAVRSGERGAAELIPQLTALRAQEQVAGNELQLQARELQAEQQAKQQQLLSELLTSIRAQDIERKLGEADVLLGGERASLGGAEERRKRAQLAGNFAAQGAAALFAGG